MRFSCGHEISDREILQAAGAIRARLRRSHRGGRRPTKRVCSWCAAECAGLKALEVHQLSCPGKPDIIPGLVDLRSLLAD